MKLCSRVGIDTAHRHFLGTLHCHSLHHDPSPAPFLLSAYLAAASIVPVPAETAPKTPMTCTLILDERLFPAIAAGYCNHSH